MAYKVFISHAGEDTWVARQIELHLKKCGAATFIDAVDIHAGDQFEEKIFVEIKNSSELVVLFTPKCLYRPYIYMEIGAARMLQIRIVIVLYGITIEEISKNPKIPQTIKGNNNILINQLDDYFEQVQKRVELTENSNFNN